MMEKNTLTGKTRQSTNFTKLAYVTIMISLLQTEAATTNPQPEEQSTKCDSQVYKTSWGEDSFEVVLQQDVDVDLDGFSVGGITSFASANIDQANIKANSDSEVKKIKIEPNINSFLYGNESPSAKQLKQAQVNEQRKKYDNVPKITRK